MKQPPVSLESIVCALLLSQGSAFAQTPIDSRITAQNLTPLPVCVCDCVYLRTDRIRNHSYFEPAEGKTCPSLEGQACLGTLRADTFRGTVAQCQEAPRQIGTVASNWMTVRQVGARQPRPPL